MSYNYHQDEIDIDISTQYTIETRAIAHLNGAIECLDPGSYLDFLQPPTEEDMISSSIRHAQAAIDILRGN